MKKTIKINPVPKPRMTRSDRWKKRKCTDAYWRFKDELQSQVDPLELPECIAITFVLPFPKSYNKKKQSQLLGQPHQQKPDWDNLAKAFFDALLNEDKHIYRVLVTKIWGYEGAIIIEDLGGMNP